MKKINVLFVAMVILGLSTQCLASTDYNYEIDNLIKKLDMLNSPDLGNEYYFSETGKKLDLQTANKEDAAEITGAMMLMMRDSTDIMGTISILKLLKVTLNNQNLSSLNYDQKTLLLNAISVAGEHVMRAHLDTQHDNFSGKLYTDIINTYREIVQLLLKLEQEIKK